MWCTQYSLRVVIENPWPVLLFTYNYYLLYYIIVNVKLQIDSELSVSDFLALISAAYHSTERTTYCTTQHTVWILLSCSVIVIASGMVGNYTLMTTLCCHLYRIWWGFCENEHVHVRESEITNMQSTHLKLYIATSLCMDLERFSRSCENTKNRDTGKERPKNTHLRTLASTE